MSSEKQSFSLKKNGQNKTKSKELAKINKFEIKTDFKMNDALKQKNSCLEKKQKMILLVN